MLQESLDIAGGENLSILASDFLLENLPKRRDEVLSLSALQL